MRLFFVLTVAMACFSGVSMGAESPGLPKQIDETIADGITLKTTIEPGKVGVLTVNCPEIAGKGYVVVFFDFNRDGDWDDEGEQLNTGDPVEPGKTLATIAYQVPMDARPGNSWARFRLASQLVTSPNGLASDGEVCDARITITGPAEEPRQMDFGSAPKSYGVTKADDGARHPAAEFKMFIGSRVDYELDGPDQND